MHYFTCFLFPKLPYFTCFCFYKLPYFTCFGLVKLPYFACIIKGGVPNTWRTSLLYDLDRHSISLTSTFLISSVGAAVVVLI